MELTSVIALILWPVTIIFFIIRNLYIKNIKLEDNILKLEDFTDNVISLSSQFSQLVDKIDETIWVQSDPEFIQLIAKAKEISETLKNYKNVDR